jgi:ubiquitin-like protein ATG12
MSQDPEQAPESNVSSDDNGTEEESGRDLPMSMTASIMLTQLPKDASQALKDIEAIDDHKSMYWAPCPNRESTVSR